MKLYVGNKNYSSWSMRVGVLPKQFDLPCETQVIRFDSFADGSTFKQTVKQLSPVGKVPILQDGDLVVWDTLAIGEYLAERFPDKGLWPQDRAARARARSICAEMHSGFSALRNACPMNIEADLSATGALILRDHAAVRGDIARIVQMWDDLLAKHGGPYLFGARFTLADAFFAPVCMRFKGYGLCDQPKIKAYIESICLAPGVKQWIADSLLEKDFVVEDEPYRLQA